MAEIGLVAFARCALEIARRAMPSYRSKFSKHIFTQPQLLAMVCLMRYEDWTFRETEIRLREHSDLRRALCLERTPDHTTFHRFLQRLPPAVIQRALQAAATQVLKGQRRGQPIWAVDATGLAPGAISTFFVKRKRDHGNGLPWRYWLKWVVVVDTQHQVLLAQLAKRGPYNDCAALRPLVDQARQVMKARCVLADAEFDSERNHRHIREVHQMRSIIPAKRGKKTWHLQGIRASMRAHFPAKQYAQRNLIETVFSVVKRKLSARAPGRSLAAQAKQALVLGLAYNLYRL